MQLRLHPGVAVGRVNGCGVTQAHGATGRKCVSGTGWLQPQGHRTRGRLSPSQPSRWLDGATVPLT